MVAELLQTVIEILDMFMVNPLPNTLLIVPPFIPPEVELMEVTTSGITRGLTVGSG